MRDRRALGARTLVLATLLAPRVFAQSAFPLMDDATSPPKGLVRFKAAALWTRFDARFTADGTRPLGSLLPE
jgi:hypothetical protein